MKYIIFILSVSISAFAQQKKTSNSNNPGRFVLQQLGEYAINTFLVDTETGRTWQIVLDKDSSRVFQEISFAYLSSDGSARVYSSLPNPPNIYAFPYKTISE